MTAQVGDGATQPGEWVEAFLVAPAAAVFLGRLESRHRTDTRRWEIPEDVDEEALAALAGALSGWPLGELLALAVAAAESNAGPWSSGAPDSVAKALGDAPLRRRLAEAVVQRLQSVLARPLDLGEQEWWWSPWPPGWKDRFAPLGEAEHGLMRSWCTASWEGIWTVSSPPEEVADDLVDVWELDRETSRWRLSVNPSARVFEVAGPADWERLVRAYPASGRLGISWELPGRNQLGQVDALAALPGQRAMRTRVRRFLVPDWNAVAVDWDGVHLTWGGFLTTEGLIIDMGSNDVAMLRGWGSERTLWLNPVLTDPEPLDRPSLTGRINENTGVDVRTNEERRAADLDWLTYRLGL